MGAILKALLGIFGEKDLVYAVLIGVGLLAGWGAWEAHDHKLRAEGAAHELAALKDSSDKLTAQNAADNAAKEAAWKAASAKTGADYEQAIRDQSAVIADLDGRLRIALTGGGKIAVPGEAATFAGPDVPTGIAGGVEPAIEGVVAAAEHDAAKVVALQDYVRNVCLADQQPNTASGVR